MFGKCCSFDENKNHNDRVYDRPKGKFSVNYLRSISSYLGYGLTEPEPGDDVNKIDVTVRASYNENWKIHTPQIDFQAKTTSKECIGEEFVTYRIETDALKLIRESASEHLLAVLCISQEPDNWVKNTDDGLLLEKQMFWYNPKKDGVVYNDTEKTTIKIPIQNVITRESLHKMMDIVGNGGEIGNVL